MIHAPDYFDRVLSSASRTWQQLTNNPELAGPWHQLFKQIQIPRHVISELLQNADDTGASRVQISIEDDVFVFKHNGRDFIEEDFQSLCRFGYSNKRALHTIGFRGIGFKSTFSIGDRIELRSPTLTVAFERERFTKPIWISGSTFEPNWTTVRVQIGDSHIRKELEKNLHEWMQSPASLLFLRSVRHLTIQGEEIRWQSSRLGPVSNSEWVAISSALGMEHLHIRSAEEPFPDDALAEISQERIVGDEELTFPPCSVEIVLGMEGAIYVMLPTTVRVGLPFAVNGPFIQDPGRSKLKEPETSYTNRWLLERVGKLAAESMLAWIQRSDLELIERCRAYGLVLQPPADDGSLESRCQRIICTAFWDTLDGHPFLLAESGALVSPGDAVAVPRGLLDVWQHPEVADIFLDAGKCVLAHDVSPESVNTLEEARCIEVLSANQIPQILEDSQPPKPGSWTRLLALWQLCSENLLSHKEHVHRTNAQIIPVSGSDLLHRSSDVIRASKRMSEQLGDDWQFLAQRLRPVNPEWINFITSLSHQETTSDADEEAARILDVLGLGRATGTSRIVENVTRRIFEEDDVSLESAVRIAQISAKLEASVTDQMHYVTRDGFIRSSTESLIADVSNELDLYVDEQWMNERVLDSDYQCQFLSCTESEWKSWIRSGKSRLLPFVPPQEQFETIYGESQFEDALRKRGVEGEIPENSYVRSEKYGLHDWDFSSELWDWWKKQADSDSSFWANLLERILQQPAWYWESTLFAAPVFIAKMGSGERKIEELNVHSAWIIKFRDLACIEDTRGNLHIPAELLVRTAETEALQSVEPFVRADLDTLETRPLLSALNVRQIPTDATGLINRLRALSSAPEPPLQEILKWYEHLDQLTESLPSEQMDELRSIFQAERLILTDAEGWSETSGIFLSEDTACVPGVATIHPWAKNLGLWHRLGVESRPTVLKVLEWLQTLPVGETLPAKLLDRVRTMLPGMATQVWTECERWLDLDGRWMRTDSFQYALSANDVSAVRELFSAIRQQTADLRFLPDEDRMNAPFATLPSLTSLIELRSGDSHELVGTPKEKAWIAAFAEVLQRIRLSEENEERTVRHAAHRLSQSTWWTVRGRLEIVPYLDGTPVGTPYAVDVVWHEHEILVVDDSAARLASAVIEEVARSFSIPAIRNAVGVCYERPPGFVHEYLEDAFALEPKQEDISATGTAQVPYSGGRDAELPPQQQYDGLAAIDPVSEKESFSQASEDWLSAEQPESEPGALPAEKIPEPRRERHEFMGHFLRAQGYSMDGSPQRFIRGSGEWIEKGDMGLWEEYDSSRELKQCYWAKEHCLERAPISLPAEIWELCRQHPSLYTLVLSDSEGNAKPYDGRILQELRETGRLKIHAAEYRLEIS